MLLSANATACLPVNSRKSQCVVVAFTCSSYLSSGITTNGSTMWARSVERNPPLLRSWRISLRRTIRSVSSRTLSMRLREDGDDDSSSVEFPSAFSSGSDDLDDFLYDEDTMGSAFERVRERDGMLLSRRDLDSAMAGQVRVARFRRRSTAQEVEIDSEDLIPVPEKFLQDDTQQQCDGTGSDIDDAPPDLSVPVLVQIAVRPLQRSFRVLGRASTKLTRVCDRCLQRYVCDAVGNFEVILCTESDGLSLEEERQVEAVEQFVGSRAVVNLSPHVRDAVYLAMPTKSLCSRTCSGIEGTSVGVLEPRRDSVLLKGGSKGFLRDPEVDTDLMGLNDFFEDDASVEDMETWSSASAMQDPEDESTNVSARGNADNATAERDTTARGSIAASQEALQALKRMYDKRSGRDK